jgi:hypothetical protein
MRIATRMGRALLTSAAAATLAAGCGSVLDVDNPNNVNAESLADPASARAQVNGGLAALTRAVGMLLSSIETASDNMSWSGSLEGMQRFDQGFMRDPFNEFLEAAYSGTTPARYTVNRAIRQLEEFQRAGVLTDPTQLALANLYAAITYDYIANSHDDFVIASNEREAGAPIGPANMVSLYDSVEAAATRGLAIPGTTAAQRGALTAMRARGKFDRAIWRKLNPSGRIAAQPLVDDAGAATEAAAALALLGSDGRFQLSIQNGVAYCNCYFAGCTNSRQRSASTRAWRRFKLHQQHARRGAARSDRRTARPAHPGGASRSSSPRARGRSSFRSRSRGRATCCSSSPRWRWPGGRPPPSRPASTSCAPSTACRRGPAPPASPPPSGCSSTSGGPTSSCRGGG